MLKIFQIQVILVNFRLDTNELSINDYFTYKNNKKIWNKIL